MTAALALRETIAKDDPTAISTAAGWKKYRLAAKRAEASSPAVPNARFWFAFVASPDGLPYPSPRVSIECERWNDARAFARIVFGGREVVVTPSSNAPRTRWQVRWSGSSMDPANAPILVARRRGAGDFLPVRDFS